MNDLERDGARLRKLGYLLDRGDWQAFPNAEATSSGGLNGPAVMDLNSLRAALDNNTPRPMTADIEGLEA